MNKRIEDYLKLRTELLEIQLLEKIYPSKKDKKPIIINKINNILSELDKNELIDLIHSDLDIK